MAVGIYFVGLWRSWPRFAKHDANAALAFIEELEPLGKLVAAPRYQVRELRPAPDSKGCIGVPQNALASGAKFGQELVNFGTELVRLVRQRSCGRENLG